MADAESISPGGDLAIQTLHLRKEYGTKVAVQDLTLEVPRGEIFGFLGPNGAGKTTAIKMFMGLVRPTSGSAKLLGFAPDDLRAKEKVGFLPELFRFHDWLTAREFLRFHAELYGMPEQKARRRIPQVLELVGLSNEAGSLLKTFSKGMQQRVGIAQAILNEPDVVFLDEPTSALDPIGRRDVRDLTRYLKEHGSTVFLNSHLLSEVEMVCDRVAIIDRGRVIATGTLQQLLAGDVEVEIEAGGITPEAIDDIRRIAYSVEALDGRVTVRLGDREQVPLVADALHRNGARLYSLSRKKGSLEDLFIRVVEQEEAR